MVLHALDSPYFDADIVVMIVLIFFQHQNLNFLIDKVLFQKKEVYCRCHLDEEQREGYISFIPFWQYPFQINCLDNSRSSLLSWFSLAFCFLGPKNSDRVQIGMERSVNKIQLHVPKSFRRYDCQGVRSSAVLVAPKLVRVACCCSKKRGNLWWHILGRDLSF